MGDIHRGFSFAWEVMNVIPEYPNKVIVQFADWSVRTIDLSHLIDSDNPGVFENLRDREFFNRVRALDGAVCWPGDIDLAPDAMYSRTH
jgi:hypothetical protein